MNKEAKVAGLEGGRESGLEVIKAWIADGGLTTLDQGPWQEGAPTEGEAGAQALVDLVTEVGEAVKHWLSVLSHEGVTVQQKVEQIKDCTTEGYTHTSGQMSYPEHREDKKQLAMMMLNESESDNRKAALILSPRK